MRDACLAVCLLLSALLGEAVALEESSGRSLAQAQSIQFSAVAERAAAHVVQLRYFGADGETLSDAPAPVSALLLAEPGWVLSSDYGLAGEPAAVVVRFADHSEAPAVLVGRDRTRRLALFRYEPPASLKPGLPFEVDPRPPVGAWAIAVGRVSPSGGHNLSVGVISAHDRLGRRALQTDASLSPANYGGPLVDLRGRLIGLITPMAPPGQSGVGWYDSGVGFVAPWSDVQTRIARMMRGETIEPGWLGLQLRDGGDPHRSPAKIDSVADKGPAAQAGLATGDRLVSLDGVQTNSVARFRRALGVRDSGEEIKLTVSREGSEFQVTVALAPRTATPDGP